MPSSLIELLFFATRSLRSPFGCSANILSFSGNTGSTQISPSSKWRTHPWKFGSTITALWCSALLLNMQISKFPTRGLHNPDPVASGLEPFIYKIWLLAVVWERHKDAVGLSLLPVSPPLLMGCQCEFVIALIRGLT